MITYFMNKNGKREDILIEIFTLDIPAVLYALFLLIKAIS